MKKLTGRDTSSKAIVWVSGGVQNEDIRYLTGFACEEGVVCCAYKRKVYLVVSPLEYGRAAREAFHGVEVYGCTRWPLPPVERFSLCAWIRALRREQGWKSVSVSHAFPLGLTQALQASGIGVETMPEPMLPARAVKEAGEIESLATAQRAAVEGMLLAARLLAEAEIDSAGRLRAGGVLLDAQRVSRSIEKALLDRDCVAGRTIVAPAPWSSDPHEVGRGPLTAGVPVVIDIFPRHARTGYWGDLTRTLVRGDPGPRWMAAYRAVREAQRAALRHIRPRGRCATVHAAAASVFTGRGFETRLDADGDGPHGFIHATGHGVGLAVHEAPRLAAGREVLRRGHVVTVEPGLYYPGWGGLRIEDTVLVTADGWRPLYRCPSLFRVDGVQSSRSISAPKARKRSSMRS